MSVKVVQRNGNSIVRDVAHFDYVNGFITLYLANGEVETLDNVVFIYV